MCNPSNSKRHSIHSGICQKEKQHDGLFFSQIARVAPQVYLSAATALVPSALEGLALTLVSSTHLIYLVKYSFFSLHIVKLHVPKKTSRSI